ncbi:hypothetical protein ABK040_005071 [Willaertia magna]
MSHVSKGSFSDAGSATTNNNLASKALKTIGFPLIISLQPLYALTSRWHYLLILLFNIYYMWIGISVSTIGSFNWGYYGSWIFEAMNYPISFALHRTSYNVIQGLAITFMVFIAVYYIMLFIFSRLYFTASKYSKYAKMIMIILNCIVVAISPVCLYIFSSFMECNLTMADKTFEGTLARYSNINCTAPTNVIMLAISSIFTVLLLASLIVAQFSINNDHPLSNAPFICDSPVFCITYILIINIQIIVSLAIPMPYLYARAVIHLVLSLLLMVVLFYKIPYFVSFENSAYSGIIGAKIGASIISLISSLVNERSEWTTGLILSGVCLGLMVVGFVTGFLAMEIYIKYTIHTFKKIINRFLIGNTNTNETLNSIEHDSLLIMQRIFEEKRVRQFNLFMKFSLRSKKHSYGISNTDISISLLKSIAQNRKYTTPEILLTGAILVTYTNDINYYGIVLFKKALGQGSIFTDFQAQKRINQLEVCKENSSIVELNRIDLMLEKDFKRLKNLHTGFWKEMLKDFVDHSYLENINREIYELTEKCGTVLSNLISNHGKTNKGMLRKYAEFIENFTFNKELSQAYYDEATNVEEEEAKRKDVNARKSFILDNRFEHTNSYRFDTKIRNDIFAEKAETFNNELRELDDNLMYEAVDEFKETKETVYFNALNTPPKFNLQCAMLIIPPFVALACLITSIVLGSFYSTTAAASIEVSKNYCFPAIIPSSALKELRFKQSIEQLFDAKYKNNINNFKWPSALNEYDINTVQVFTKQQRMKMNSYSSLVDNLVKTITKSNQELLNYYSLDETVVLYEPKIENNYLHNAFTTRNSTNSELLSIYRQSINEILRLDSDNVTMEDYSFMFLYNNIDTASESLMNFCDSILNFNHNVNERNANTFFYYFITTSMTFAVILLIIMLISIINVLQVRFSIKTIEKYIPKHVSGKIYQDLSSKYKMQHNANSVTSITKPLFAIPLLTFVIICVVVLCGAIINNESESNYLAVTISAANVKDPISAIILSQTFAFRVGEIFISSYSRFNNSIDSPLLITPTQFLKYRNELSDVHQYLVRHFNSFRYGDRSGSSPILGIYPEIDELFYGIPNCTFSDTIKCKGLNEFMRVFLMHNKELNELLKVNNYNVQELFERYMELYPLSNAIYNKIFDIINIWINKSSTETRLDVIIGVGVGGIVLTLIIWYGLYLSYTAHWGHIRQLRLMVNYVPISTIEACEELENFVLYNRLNSSKSNKVSSTNETEDSKVKSILNAAVDGAILANSDLIISIFNPASQRMFGLSLTDVIGMPITSLFDPSHHNTIKHFISNLLDVRNSKNSNGETLEMECIRKNQTKFTSKVNLFISNFDGKPVIVCFIKDITQEKKQNILLEEEKKKSENLLLNIFPVHIAQQLKIGESFIAEKYSDCTCFFSDMVGFTSLSSGLTPSDLVEKLNSIVNGFDDLTEVYDLEKIKTIGDAYFAVGWGQSDHPERALKFSMAVFKVLFDHNTKAVTNDELSPQINVRIGLNTGSVVAGVIGKKKFAFDLWGDAVNVASRMESTSEPGRIQISRSTYERVYDLGYKFEERKVNVKGKGLTTTYMLDSKHHSAAIVSINNTINDFSNPTNTLDSITRITNVDSEVNIMDSISSMNSFLK